MKQKPLFTQTITPADSSEEENSPPFPYSIHRPQPSSQLSIGSSALQISAGQDTDIDMADSPMRSPRGWNHDTLMLSPQASPRTLMPQTTSTEPHGMAISGRIPTPIYGHFQQSIDTKMDVAESSGLTPPMSHQDPEHEACYTGRRPLPSPISEDETMHSPMNSPTGLAMAGDPERLDMTAEQNQRQRRPARFPPPLPSQSPKRGKMMFSMGWRADCEMCRNRVPGHSNHIFRLC